MTRTPAGAVGYSLYDAHGTLINHIEGPNPASGIGSIREFDIAPDGNRITAGSDATGYAYDKTNGICAEDMFLYVLGLPTGEVQYTVPLLRSSKELLSEIRNAVVEPYDERKYLVDDPETYYQKQMEDRVRLAWDAYIYSLGSLAWSPDGTQIAFSAQSDGIKTAIRILDLSTGSIKTVIEKPIYFSSLLWSPDSRWILAQEFEIGTYLDADWYAYSVDGKQSVQIPDNGEDVEWLDSHTIVHVAGEYNPHIRLFDIFSKEDALLFNNRIERFAISTEARFAAFSEPEAAGITNVWYCPFDGPENILLDGIAVPEGTSLIELYAFPPNRVFLEFQRAGISWKNPIKDIWMYSPGSERQILGEDVSDYALSPDGRLFAFSPIDGHSLFIKKDNQDVGEWTVEEPELMLWDPRSEFLLSKTAGEINIIRFDKDQVNAISLPPGGAEYIAYWVK